MLDVTLCCLCQTAVRVRRVRCDRSCCLCQTAVRVRRVRCDRSCCLCQTAVRVRRVRCDLVLFVPDCSEGETC